LKNYANNLTIYTTYDKHSHAASSSDSFLFSEFHLDLRNVFV
jgi:hypothetical protein